MEKLTAVEAPVSLVEVTETVPVTVPSTVNGTRTVARLPKPGLPAYQVLKMDCTWNVTVDPDVEQSERPPQLRRIGVVVLNWNDRVNTCRLAENMVNDAINPVGVFSVVMGLRVGALCATNAVVEKD